MAKHPKAEALIHILAHLRELSKYADKNDLTTVFYMIEVAIMEAEYERTGVFPTLPQQPQSGPARIN
jgi:hypothetical protein